MELEIAEPPLAPGAILLRFLLAITLAKIRVGIQFGKWMFSKGQNGPSWNSQKSLQNSPQARIPNLIPYKWRPMKFFQWVVNTYMTRDCP